MALNADSHTDNNNSSRNKPTVINKKNVMASGTMAYVPTEKDVNSDMNKSNGKIEQSY